MKEFDLSKITGRESPVLTDAEQRENEYAGEIAALREKCEELQRQLDDAAKQEPVSVVRMTDPPDGNPKPVPKWIPEANFMDMKDGDKLYRHPPNLPALIEQAKAEERERLNFVLAQQAFVYTRKEDSGADTYQLWTQDEDEEFHVLHDDSEFFSTPIDAVDAAIRARSETK